MGPPARRRSSQRPATIIAIVLLCWHMAAHSRADRLPSCDDSNACTFDWSETTPGKAAEPAAECHHEFIPPVCQPLLVHSAAPAYSSLNAHGATFDVRSTPPASAHQLTERLMAEPLDIVLFVSTEGDWEVARQRTWNFIENMQELNFHGKEGDRLKYTPLRPLQPFWTLVVYNATHSEVVQPLTRSFDTLLDTVRQSLLGRMRAMEPRGQPSVTTPIGLYRALTSFLSTPPSRHTPTTFRPHAHQHLVVLDGIGSLPDAGSDANLRIIPQPTPQEVKECEHALAGLVGVLATKEGPAATRSSSFAIFFPAGAKPFFNASIGSPKHTAAYEFDSSQYNPALTLRRLIRDKTPAPSADASLILPAQPSSFLAQALSRAYTARAYDIAQLEVKWNGQLAHIWEEHYRHPRSTRPWCSARQSWTCDPTNGWFEAPVMPCAPGEETGNTIPPVSSALHGCHLPLPKGLVAADKARLGVTQIAGITSAGPRGGEKVGGEDGAEEEVDQQQQAADANGEIEVTVDDVGSLHSDAFGTTNSTDETLNATTSTTASSPKPLVLEGAPFPLFHTYTPATSSSSSPPSPQRFTPDHHHRRRSGRREIEVKHWYPSADFTLEMIAGGRPVLLKNTVVSTWKALTRWNATYLRDAFVAANLTMSKTKVSRTRKFFDPDRRTPLSLPSIVNLTMTYDEVDLTPEELFGNITKGYSLPLSGVGREEEQRPETDGTPSDSTPPADSLYYHFGSFPPSLLPDITPYAQLYSSHEDLSKNAMFLWFSSAGVNMHTHFDQDHNFFVQLAGRKRFTLVMPEQWRAMSLFPRIHPLWHKSQVDFDRPDLELFPEYATKVDTYVVEVGPGDVLYIPPYCWHQVETVTPSVSMSIWSHDTPTVRLMERVYKHDHKIDLLASTEGRTYALRLYIDLMIYELYGAQRTTRWIQQLVRERYRPLVDIFREEHRTAKKNAQQDGDASSDRDQQRLCPLGQIPTAQHVYGDAVVDKGMMSSNFDVLQPASTRDILFVEYIEELTAAVVGPLSVMRFFMECFQGQTYRLTSVGSEEHERLWRHV